MKKYIVSFLFLISLNLCVFADIRVGILNGPSCVPSAYLMENVMSVQEETLEFVKYADAMALVPKLLKNEIDIGFLPINVAAKLYNSSNKAILCGAVTGEGNISLITKDQNLSSLEDLKGKTVYVAGEGATPDYLLKYLLDFYGITYSENPQEDSVQLCFNIPTAQLASQLITGKIKYAVVPEPFSTIACDSDPSIVKAVDFQQEYKKVTGENNYPLTVLVINRKFAENKTDALNTFLKLYEEAVQFTKDYPADSGILCQKYDLGLKSKIVEKSIPLSNYVFMPANQCIKQVEALLNIFLENNPSSIGDKLPDEEFYY